MTDSTDPIGFITTMKSPPSKGSIFFKWVGEKPPARTISAHEVCWKVWMVCKHFTYLPNLHAFGVYEPCIFGILRLGRFFLGGGIKVDKIWEKLGESKWLGFFVFFGNQSWVNQVIQAVTFWSPSWRSKRVQRIARKVCCRCWVIWSLLVFFYPCWIVGVYDNWTIQPLWWKLTIRNAKQAKITNTLWGSRKPLTFKFFFIFRNGWDMVESISRIFVVSLLNLWCLDASRIGTVFLRDELVGVFFGIVEQRFFLDVFFLQKKMGGNDEPHFESLVQILCA